MALLYHCGSDRDAINRRYYVDLVGGQSQRFLLSGVPDWTRVRKSVFTPPAPWWSMVARGQAKPLDFWSGGSGLENLYVRGLLSIRTAPSCWLGRLLPSRYGSLSSISTGINLSFVKEIACRPAVYESQYGSPKTGVQNRGKSFQSGTISITALSVSIRPQIASKKHSPP